MTPRGLLFVVALCGCAKIHHRAEEWVRVDGIVTSDPRVQLSILPTRSDSGGGILSDRVLTDAAPYTASITASFDQQVDAPLRVHGVEVLDARSGTPRTILAESQPALEAAVEQVSGPKPWAATVRVPLGDQLVFVENDATLLVVEVTIPGDATPKVLRQSFEGRRSEVSGPMALQ
ncbi:MAG TPA: hypothetical protein VG755_10840 [Nannocystaceae bacterium]|nr:hypothetical protein [Nannocystaceae bacterium]